MELHLWARHPFSSCYFHGASEKFKEVVSPNPQHREENCNPNRQNNTAKVIFFEGLTQLLDLFLTGIKGKALAVSIQELRAPFPLPGVVKYANMLFLVTMAGLKIRAIHISFMLQQLILLHKTRAPTNNRAGHHQVTKDGLRLTVRCHMTSSPPHSAIRWPAVYLHEHQADLQLLF